jgi:4-hydroxy-3-methylbut-2-en-1-yl diphosphate synthase IspG/GcpE
MTDPTKDIPANRPLGQSDPNFEFGTLRFGVTGAPGVGAVVELADQLNRTGESVKATIPVVADIHHSSANRTITVEDIEFPVGEIRILGPSVRHPADLRAWRNSIDVVAEQELTLGND